LTWACDKNVFPISHPQENESRYAPKFFLFLLPLLLSSMSEAHASQTCAATLSELGLMLGEQSFPLKWEETTMDGSLFLEFTKTGEGLWAESLGIICKTGTDFEARFSGKQIRLGPAANWVLRYALRNGGKFTLTKLGPDRLRIATSSWSGLFSPLTK
jgi:hypothetical protein